MIGRLDNWPSLLFKYIDEAEQKPFKWGEHDCGLFVLGAIEAMTGKNLSAPFQTYSTERGAYRMLKKYADGGLREAAEKYAAELGIEEVSSTRAQRGDACLMETGGRDALGICLGIWTVIPGPQKLERLKTVDAIKAWRI